MTANHPFRHYYATMAQRFRDTFASRADRANDPEFRAYCDKRLADMARDQAELDVMFAHADEVGMGAVFQHGSRNELAILFPDASTPGHFRYQVCGAGGWSSHSTFATVDEVVFEAHRAGFVQPVPTATLEQMIGTDEWEKGNAITAVIDQINRKHITLEQGNAEISAIQERYAQGDDQEQEPLSRSAKQRMR